SFLIERVIMPGTTHLHTIKSAPVLETLDGVDAKHSLTELGVKFVKNRFTQSNRRVKNNAGHNATNSIPVQPDLLDELYHLICCILVRTADDVLFRSG